MKKSVILVILVIYIASFFIVGFFGEKIKVYDPSVRVTALECAMTVDGKTVVDTSKTQEDKYLKLLETSGINYIFNYNFKAENIGKGLQVVLVFRVLPENADNKIIHYTVDKDTEEGENKIYDYVDNGDGTATFTFWEPYSVDFIIASDDVGADVHVKARISVNGTRDYYQNI